MDSSMKIHLPTQTVERNSRLEGWFARSREGTYNER
jgi:hypothetical protein